MIAIMERRKLDVVSVLAGSALGLGIGGLAGYLLARLHARHAFEQRIASEVREIEKHYQLRSDAAAAARDHEDERVSSVGGVFITEWPPEVAELFSDAGLAESEVWGAFQRAGVSPVLFTRPVISRLESGEYGPDPHGMGSVLSVTPVPDASGGYDDPSEEDLVAAAYGDGDVVDPDENDDIEVISEEDADPVLEAARVRGEREVPYVITAGEFNDDEPEYRKITITWYVKDKTLTDDRTIPILDYISLAGPDFERRFGDGSDNPDIVHVRNHRLRADFEIVRNEGSYMEEVLKYGRPQ
jgi:hypothetical protein